MTTQSISSASDYAAEIAITLMLMLTQRDQAIGGSARSRQPQPYAAARLAGRTLGIIGFGKVGREVARRAQVGFAMNVLAFDRMPIDPVVLSVYGAKQPTSLEELLAASDFVSLHCPDRPENRHLIDAVKLNAMKATAYLINTSHGELVDAQALVQALWFDTIAGAGIDLCQEDIRAYPALAQCERVVMLDHASDCGAQAA